MGDSDDLPSEYDVIIVGTGMVESIVAAASARIGKKVLHLDSNNYYGQFWATISFDSINDLIKKYTEQNKDEIIDPGRFADQEHTLCFTRSEILSVENLIYQWRSYTPDQIIEPKNVKENEKVEPLDSSISENEENISQIDESIKKEGNKEKSIDESIEKQEKTVEESVKKEEKKETSSNEWTCQKIRESYRKFNLDLAPKVLFSTGPMVNLLLHSSVSRYTQFLNISQILTYKNDKIEKVPCSKSDVFSSKSVSIVDKRILMKVLNNCLNLSTDSEEFQGHCCKTFHEYLKGEQVPDHLIHYILYSIAMATKETPFAKGIEVVQLFLKNIGRYGNSPFLWPLFGTGEILQAFCRLCAVFGGIYYLTRGAEAVALDSPDHCCGIISNSKLLKADNVVLSIHSCPPQFIDSTGSGTVSRALLITDRSLFPLEKDGILMLNYPPKSDGNDNLMTLIELPPSSGACPPGLYVVHMTISTPANSGIASITEAIDNLFIRNGNIDDKGPNYDKLLEKITDRRLNSWIQSAKESSIEELKEKPKILYSLIYSLKDSHCFTLKEERPSNLHFCQGPNEIIDFESVVSEAENIFQRMYPNEPFLEPVPDPNEVTLSDLVDNQQDAINSEENNQQQEEAINSEGNDQTQNDDEAGPLSNQVNEE